MATIFSELDPGSGRVVPSPRAEAAEVEGDGRCHLCGARTASGVWFGMRTVQTCGRCAVEDLPRLIADAVVGQVFEIQARTRERFALPDPGHHEGILREIAARFSDAYLAAARAAEEVPPRYPARAELGTPGRRGY